LNRGLERGALDGYSLINQSGLHPVAHTKCTLGETHITEQWVIAELQINRVND